MVRRNLKEDMFEVINKIDEYIKQYEWPYSDWVVGTSPDPSEKFDRSEVLKEAFGPWIYKMAANAEFAKAIEKHFTDILGTSAEPSLFDSNARVVYAYRKKADGDNPYVILN